MAQIDEIYKKRISKLLQAFLVTKYAKEDNIPCKIEEGLFLGSVGVACNKELLKSLNVTHILVVAQSLEPAYPNDFVYKKIEVLDSPQTNLEQYFSECFDFIDEAKRSGGGVLVHCFAGKSRRTLDCGLHQQAILPVFEVLREYGEPSDCISLLPANITKMSVASIHRLMEGDDLSPDCVTIVLAYLMKKHHMSLAQALDFVKSRRPEISPNYGFMTQLRAFERTLGVNRNAEAI